MKKFLGKNYSKNNTKPTYPIIDKYSKMNDPYYFDSETPKTISYAEEGGGVCLLGNYSGLINNLQNTQDQNQAYIYEAAEKFPGLDLELPGEVGSKAANLGIIKDIANRASDKYKEFCVSFEVPEYATIKDVEIKRILDKNAEPWHELWNDFVKLRSENKDALSVKEKEILSEIREVVSDVLKNSDYIISIPKNAEEKFMVRSSGNEDGANSANPGGNESVVSDKENVKDAIAIVVASYFSEKSMEQRISNGDSIEKMPLTPVLIQNLIQNIGREMKPVISGVIYAQGQEGTRIDAAYGHGEYVVNNLGPTDKIFVTDNNEVHAYPAKKQNRLVQEIDPEAGKTIKKLTANNKGIKDKLTINSEVSLALSAFGREATKIYGRDMDIEFVLDNEKVYIVQARPIPLGKRGKLVASTLSNKFISKNKPYLFEGTLATPAINDVRIASKKDEFLVHEGINQALHEYHNINTESQGKIKAIIVKKSVGSTSHEAGFFNSEALPIISFGKGFDKISNKISEIESSTDNLVIDPQNQGVFEIDKELLKATPEAIIKGIYYSSLPKMLDMQIHEKAMGPAIFNNTAIIEEQIFQGNRKFGDVLREAKFDPNYVQFMNDYVYDNHEGDIKSIDEARFVAQKLRTNYNKNEIAKLYHFAMDLYEDRKISDEAIDTFIRIIKELDINGEYKNNDPGNKDLVKHYLNSQRMLEAIIDGKEAEEFVTNSIAKELKKYEQKENIKRKLDDSKINIDHLQEKDRAEFYNMASYYMSFLNKQNGEEWLKFCGEVYKKSENKQAAQELMEKLAQMQLEMPFLNKYFDENDTSPLSNLLANYEQIEKSLLQVAEIEQVITSLSSKIDAWSSPQNFEQLQKILDEQIAAFSRNIDFSKLEGENNELARIKAAQYYVKFIDIIDLSLKKLQNSPDYKDKLPLHEERFKKMLTSFGKLLNDHGAWKNSKYGTAEDRFNGKFADITGGMQPSGKFLVDAALIFQWSMYAAMEGMSTLGDVHTFIHQNLIEHAGTQSKSYIKKLIENSEGILKKIDEQFKSIETTSGKINIIIEGGEFLKDEIKLYYNLPLREHSAKLKLIYNLATKETKIEYVLQGNNEGENEGRWPLISYYINKMAGRGAEFFGIDLETNFSIQEYPIIIPLGIVKIDIDLNKEFDFEMLKNLIIVPAKISFHPDKIQGEKDIFAQLLEKCEEIYKQQFNLITVRADLLELLEKYKNPSLKARLIDDALEKNIIKKEEYFSFMKDLIKKIKDDDVAAKIVKRYIENGNIDDVLGLVEIISSYGENLSHITKMLLEQLTVEKVRAVAQKTKNELFLKEISIGLLERKNEELSLSINEKIKKRWVLREYALALIKMDRMDLFLDVANKITDNSKLEKIFVALVEKNHLNEALKIAEKMDEFDLKKISLELIDKDQVKAALNIAVKIKHEYNLKSISLKLIEKNHLEEALDIAVKINDKYKLKEIVSKLIEKNHVEAALDIAVKINDEYTFSNLFNKLIDKGHLEEVLNIAVKIKNEYKLKEIVFKLIDKDHVKAALNIAVKIKNEYNLKEVVSKLIEKNHVEEALDIAVKIKNEIFLKSISIKLKSSGYDERLASLIYYDAGGKPYLSFASERGDMDVIKLMFEPKINAKVNAIDKDGKTALMYAAENGKKEVVDFLIEKGADIKIKDNNGKTAQMLASEKFHSEISSKISNVIISHADKLTEKRNNEQQKSSPGREL